MPTSQLDKITGPELNKYLLRKYKITPDEYERIGESQAWLCAICGEKSERRLFVDHCHKSKAVRGLLCHSCNIGIGHLRDCPRRLRAAIEYLENPS